MHVIHVGRIKSVYQALWITSRVTTIGQGSPSSLEQKLDGTHSFECFEDIALYN